MRKLAYVTGLVAFATIATGGERVAQQGGKITWSTTLITHEDKAEKLEFARANRYYFDDVNPKDVKNGALPYDKDAVINQYTPFYEKVNGKTVRKYRKRTVDCRLVAKKMVGALMTHDVNDVASFDMNKAGERGLNELLDGESREYNYRNSELKVYSPLIARNLDKISIRKGGKPGFECKRTEVPATEGASWDREYAACGNLSITFKPQKSFHKDFLGHKAIVIEDKSCDEECITMRQVEGCGLYYVQLGLNTKRDRAKQSREYYCNPKNAKHFAESNKIKADRICNASTVGLYEFLMNKAIEEKSLRESGQYTGIKSRSNDAPMYVEDDETSIQCEGDCEIFGAPSGVEVR